MKRPGSNPPPNRPPLPAGKGRGATPPAKVPGQVSDKIPGQRRATVTRPARSASAAIAASATGLSVSNRFLLGIAIMLLSSIAAIITVMAIVKSREGQPNPAPEPLRAVPSGESSVPDDGPKGQPPDLTGDGEEDPGDSEMGREQPPSPPTPPSESDPEAAAPGKAAEALPEVKPVEETADVSEEAFAWVHQLQGRTLSLPHRTPSLTSRPIETLAEPTAGQRARVANTDPDDSLISLKLLGVQTVFGAEDAIALVEVPENKLPGKQEAQSKTGNFLIARTWRVLSKGGLEKEAIELGQFAIHDDCLTFTWDRRGVKSDGASRLQYCLLEISTGGGAGRSERSVCRLCDPIVVKLFEFDFLDADRKIELPSLNVDQLPDERHLRMDVIFEGFPDHEKETDQGVGVDEVLITTFRLEDQFDGPNPGVEIGAEFLLDKHPVVRFQVSAFPDRSVADVEDREKTSVDRKAWSEIKLKIGRRKKQLSQELFKLSNQKQLLERDLRNIALQILNGPIAFRDSLQERQRQMQQMLDNVETEISKNQEAEYEIETKYQWRQQVINAFPPRHPDRKFGVKLFIEIDGHEVVVAGPQSAAQDR